MGWIADLLKEIPSAARYKAELEELEREHAEAKAEVARLQLRVADLESQLRSLTPAPGRATTLDPTQQQLLVYVGKNAGATSDAIARACDLNVEVANFHLQELQSAGLAGCTLRVGARFHPWHLMHEGRRYLVTNNLLA